MFSEINKFLPLKSTATATESRLALVPGPPSPLKPIMPFPATVVIMPVPTATRRMRLPLSTKNKLPPPSIVNPETLRPAIAAGPPSPLKLEAPDPATVTIIPVLTSSRRMRFWSAMNRWPLPSTVNPRGELNIAFVPGPPSPLKPFVPLPATDAMLAVPAASRRIR